MRLLNWIWGWLYAGTFAVTAMLFYPLYVPRQTWALVRDDVSAGRTHWFMGTVVMVSSTAASLAIGLLGMFFIACVSGLILIGLGYSG